MRRIFYAIGSLSLLGLAGCPTGPTLPTTTSGGGWIISTGYISPTLITSAPSTTVTGDWQSDGPGAAGDPSAFVVTTDPTSALAAVVNGRVPATWKITWNSSLTFPECDGLVNTATPSYQGGVEEVNCVVTTAEADSSSFKFEPDPINLYYAPPVTSTIVGSSFSAQYGMPIVQYFNSQGTLVAQDSASYVSNDGTTIQEKTPSLSQVGYGTYAGIISNMESNGKYGYVGAVSVAVVDIPPPPVCTKDNLQRIPNYICPPPNGNRLY